MENIKTENKLKKWALPIILCFTFTLMLVCGIVTHQKFIKLLPSLISLVVIYLVSKANRFNFILGACNAVIYCIGYFMEGLYASIVSSVVISMPIQIASFITWKKNSKNASDAQATQMKSFSKMVLLGIALGLFAAAVGLYFIFSGLQGAKMQGLDVALLVVGTTASVFMMLRYYEAIYFYLANAVINFAMWLIIVIGNIANINYLISAVYTVISSIIACYNWRKIYILQEKAKKESINDN